MHKNSLILHGATHGELFSGVIWRDMDETNLDFTKDKIQEMLDACHSLIEGHTKDSDAAGKMVDQLINNWQRTGMVEGE